MTNNSNYGFNRLNDHNLYNGMDPNLLQGHPYYAEHDTLNFTNPSSFLSESMQQNLDMGNPQTRFKNSNSYNSQILGPAREQFGFSNDSHMLPPGMVPQNQQSGRPMMNDPRFIPQQQSFKNSMQNESLSNRGSPWNSYGDSNLDYDAFSNNPHMNKPQKMAPMNQQMYYPQQLGQMQTQQQMFQKFPGQDMSRGMNETTGSTRSTQHNSSINVAVDDPSMSFRSDHPYGGPNLSAPIQNFGYQQQPPLASFFPQPLNKSQKGNSTMNLETSSSHIEDMLEAISTSAHGASKYLHEVCDKLQKAKPITDYSSKIVDKQTVFVAIVTMEKYKANKDGRSKQEAKNSASLEVLRQLIENDKIAESSLDVIIYKDKSISNLNKSQGTTTITKQQPSQIMEPIIKQIQPEYQLNHSDEDGDDIYNRFRSQSTKDRPTSLNDSYRTSRESDDPRENDSLAEMNEIGNDNSITAKWNDQPDRDGFSSEILFGDLPPFAGWGKKKRDARREAASKLLKYMQSSKELKDRYLRKYEKRKLQKGITSTFNESTISEINDSSHYSLNNMSTIGNPTSQRSHLDRWLEPSIFTELKTHLSTVGSTNFKDRFDNHLKEKLEGLGVNGVEQTNFQAYCDYVTNIIDKTIAMEASITANNPNSFGKILKTTTLFTLGSYALRHLRRDYLIADFSLVYQLKDGRTKIDDRTLLGHLSSVLKSNFSQNSSFSKFSLDIKLESLVAPYDDRTCCIILRDKNSGVGVRVFACEQIETSPGSFSHEPIIIHIVKIESCLKKSESIRGYFNTVCALLKYWRRKSEMETVLRSEIIDILSYDLAANHDIKSPGLGIYYILNTLSNSDTTLKILTKYNDYLCDYYRNLDEETKNTLRKNCSNCVRNLVEGRFSQANF